MGDASDTGLRGWDCSCPGSRARHSKTLGAVGHSADVDNGFEPMRSEMPHGMMRSSRLSRPPTRLRTRRSQGRRSFVCITEETPQARSKVVPEGADRESGHETVCRAQAHVIDGPAQDGTYCKADQEEAQPGCPISGTTASSAVRAVVVHHGPSHLSDEILFCS